MDKNELRENIRKNLIALRTNKGITQAELGDEVNKSKTTVASWEQGLSLPDVTTLYQLSKFFNKDLEYFYKNHTEDKKESFRDTIQVIRLSEMSDKKIVAEVATVNRTKPSIEKVASIHPVKKGIKKSKINHIRNSNSKKKEE